MKFDFKPIFKALFWIVFFVALAMVLFFAGLAIGYGVLGDGEMMDVFKYETWQHILDYIRQLKISSDQKGRDVCLGSFFFSNKEMSKSELE